MYIIYAAYFFWSFTTLMIMSTLTIYHETVLNISKLKLGSIQAYATLSMYGTKFFSGLIIDIFKNYKSVLIFGSILSMIARPMFAFVSTPFNIFLVRSFERLTKGVRGSPADAFLTLNTEKKDMGRAIAFKQVAYTAGAIMGSICAAVFLYFFSNDFQTLYKLSIIPGLLATILLFYIEPIEVTQKQSKKKGIEWGQLKQIPSALIFMYFLTYAVCSARFGENFVGHRFHEFGLSTTWIPLVYVIFDLPWLLISLFLSKKLDTSEFKKVFLYGVGFLFLANALLMSTHFHNLVLGCICAGIYAAIIQGVLLMQVAKFTPKDIRGTAFSLYYIVSGLGYFTSFKMTGYLAQTYNTWRAGFLAQAIISFGLILLIIVIPKRFFQEKTS
ncbi:MAG: MFS transporter [Alphaproteobacteria bacterium]|nr:MAG: MFS transporter [Alphaproteobacteria bacterium]